MNIFNHLKVTVLNNDILRFEYCPDNNFSNKESLFIKNKKPSNSQISFSKEQSISFMFKDFNISFVEEDPLNTLLITKNNELVYKYKNIKNTGELPLPNKTPSVFPLMDSPRLIIADDGYVTNNNGFVLQNNVKDLYLLFCDKDYLKLRRQFIQLTGQNEMPLIKNFGLFSSRYFKYTQKGAMEMIQNYAKHKIPLDTFIIDTDWRKQVGMAGCGYDVNEELFPNIQEFYHYAHKHNVNVMMNDHPLPLNKKSKVLDNDEIEYRTTNLLKYYAKGLDGWWYDRNWSSKLNSGNKNIASETLGNYLFNDVTKQFNLGFVLDPEVYNRSLIMSNINNIKNGIYDEILDSRSHTYSLQWSGDITSDEQSLRNEIINLNKCANNMIAYYSSDIGGHMGNPDKYQYIRWMEYGAFSPVLRPHCSCDVKKFREPWNYDKTTLEICGNYINMRYRLLNVFYTASYKHVDNGLGVCSPTYLYYPNDKKCYQNNTSFMLGNNILVSPITGADKPHSLTQRNFINKLRLTIYPNANFKGPKAYTKVVKSFTDINKFYSSIKRQFPKVKQFSLRFKGDVRLSHEYQLTLRNDVPSKVYVNNKLLFNDFVNHYSCSNEITSLKRNRKYSLSLETIQGRKLSTVDLSIYRKYKTVTSKTYLPEGEWFNVFHRNVYQGKRFVKDKFKMDQTPVFVKAGSLLALYKTVDNISNMSLKNVVYDYYTSKKENISDFFYEDDGITTGYMVGEYRKNNYQTYFKDDMYVIKLAHCDNILDDSIKARNVIFKAHIRDNETIEKVLLNNEEIRFKRHDHNKKAFPFIDNEFARDSKTLTFKFRQNIKEDYEIKLIIKKDQ